MDRKVVARLPVHTPIGSACLAFVASGSTTQPGQPLGAIASQINATLHDDSVLLLAPIWRGTIAT